MTNIKTRALLYSKGPKVKQYQGGGYFNSGVYAPEEKELFPNIQKPGVLNSPIVGNPSTDYFSKAQENLKGYKQPDLTPKPLTNVKPAGYALNKAADIAVKTPEIDLSKPVAPPAQPGVDPSSLVNSGTQIVGALGKNASAGTAGAIGAAANVAGDLFAKIGDDNDATTYTNAEKVATVGSATLKGAGIGASIGTMIFPGVGTILGGIAGAIGGVVAGLFGKGKKKKAAAKAKNTQSVKIAAQLNARNRQNLTKQDAELSQGVSTTGQQTPEVVGYNREGGTFHWTLPTGETINVVKRAPVVVKKFKRGGKVKDTENIIPNGVLHEEKNQLGDKGMPVVKCRNNSCSKQYEIERDEMILTFNTTKEIERLAKGKKFAELGEYVKKQVLQNTHSFTNKFVDLNNYKGTNETIHS